MSLPNCRVAASALFPLPSPLLFPLLSVLALAACGGGGDDESRLNDVFTCTLRNCTESSTLNVDEISPRFTATMIDANRNVSVEGSLGKSANVFTTVQPASNESLMIGADGEAEVRMSNPDGKRLDYTASVNSSAVQPLVRVVFTRAGVRHVSDVTMPTAFTILQPVGTPTLRRTGPALAVRLNVTTSGDAGAIANGSCTRADGSTFVLKEQGLGAVAETGVAGGYRLEPAVVDTALNNASRVANNNDISTPVVTQCNLSVGWVRSADGHIAPTMNGHGTLTARRMATQAMTYDARS